MIDSRRRQLHLLRPRPERLDIPLCPTSVVASQAAPPLLCALPVDNSQSGDKHIFYMPPIIRPPRSG